MVEEEGEGEDREGLLVPVEVVVLVVEEEGGKGEEEVGV